INFQVKNQVNLLPIYINNDEIYYNKVISNDSCTVISTVINYNFISITNGTESQEIGYTIESKSERTVQTSYSKSSKAKEIVKAQKALPRTMGITLVILIIGVLIF
ncbi:MAG: hypothetical protein RIR94_1251, partial [Bacteroidota bacterium]